MSTDSAHPPAAPTTSLNAEAVNPQPVPDKEWAHAPMREHEIHGDEQNSNRLMHEVSPYLRQHARNPVDWWPWGEAAFAEAKKQNKPVFISIGYAACHWCHVMAHDVFENDVAAKFINEHFLPIKIDREEHPEVDAVYMRTLVAMTGHGGWPLNVWTDHEGVPFYAASTLLMEGMGPRRPGFMQVAQSLADAWQNDRQNLVKHTGQVAKAIASMDEQGQKSELAEHERMLRSLDAMGRGWDNKNKGFGQHQKFPMSPHLASLQEISNRHNKADAAQKVTEMLDAMALGGLHDHLGGGFHRYCVDANWTVPHFEKMLYDNGQLASIYLRSSASGNHPHHRAVAAEILDYLLREMRGPDGTFYASTDADDPLGEGHFFCWTPPQLHAELTQDEVELFTRSFNVDERGNFEHGLTVLKLSEFPDQAQQSALQPVLQKLRKARAKRPQPATDTKRVSSWNGLVISALAQAAVALDEPRYGQAALRAAEAFFQARDPQGLMPSRLPGRDEKAPPPRGGLAAQALMAKAFLDLYAVDFGPVWLERADELMTIALPRFQDVDTGVLYTSDDQRKDLFVRLAAWDGNAVPSPGAATLAVLQQLLAFGVDRDRFAGPLHRGLEAARAMTDQRPGAYPELAAVLDRQAAALPEILISGPDDDTTKALLVTARKLLPQGAVLGLRLSDGPLPDPERFGLFADREPDDSARAFVCRHGVCERPVRSPDELAALINKAPQTANSR